MAERRQQLDSRGLPLWYPARCGGCPDTTAYLAARDKLLLQIEGCDLRTYAGSMAYLKLSGRIAALDAVISGLGNACPVRTRMPGQPEAGDGSAAACPMGGCCSRLAGKVALALGQISQYEGELPGDQS